MISPTDSTTSRSSMIELAKQALAWLDSIPYTLLAIPLRLAVATVFWNSAIAHLASWETTLALFADEYKVPILAPDHAAYMAVSIEVTTPTLLILAC